MLIHLHTMSHHQTRLNVEFENLIANGNTNVLSNLYVV